MTASDAHVLEISVTSGLLLGRIFEEAGLPGGLLSVIVGTGEQIGDAFDAHRIPCVMSFTGSTKVGRGVAKLVSSAQIIKGQAVESTNLQQIPASESEHMLRVFPKRASDIT